MRVQIRKTMLEVRWVERCERISKKERAENFIFAKYEYKAKRGSQNQREMWDLIRIYVCESLILFHFLFSPVKGSLSVRKKGQFFLLNKTLECQEITAGKLYLVMINICTFPPCAVLTCNSVFFGGFSRINRDDQWNTTPNAIITYPLDLCSWMLWCLSIAEVGLFIFCIICLKCYPA